MMAGARVSRLLVTGFGPFPGIAHNVSDDLARHCAEAWAGDTRLRVRFERLATEWRAAPTRVAALIAEEQPHVALHLGVSDEAWELTLERCAWNFCCGSPDAAGATIPPAPLSADAPERVDSTAPIDAMARALALEGIPVAVSEDPGRYLCNAVYHESLRAMASTPPSGQCAHSLFVHVPPEFDEEHLDVASAVRGLTQIRDLMLETVRSPDD